MYKDVITDLRKFYDRDADERNVRGIEAWKAEERQHFLMLLQQEGKQTLLEIGAGPGRDSLFFQQNGLLVTCTDLSPKMVDLCQQKGLKAYVMDFLSLDFPLASFDAIYALNCLLHVPTSDLCQVLQTLQGLLKPGGLFFLSVYGGIEHEGVWPEDVHDPPRFFAYHADQYMQQAVAEFFAVVSFKAIPVTHGRDARLHAQTMILRKSL